jgi:uncharacterized protein YjbI with pentapeptide repeats
LYGPPLREHLLRLAQAHQATIAKTLDKSVDYFVAGQFKPISSAVQNKLASLKRQGATIIELDADQFQNQFTPTIEQVVELIKRPSEHRTLALVIANPSERFGYTCKYEVHDADLTRTRVEHQDLRTIKFVKTRFNEAKLAGVRFGIVERCSFDRATLEDVSITNAIGGTFRGATIIPPFSFDNCSKEVVDFSKARGDGLKFSGEIAFRGVNASLRNTVFTGDFSSLDCAGADLTGTSFEKLTLQRAIFTAATLRDVCFHKTQLSNADFRNADLTRANLTDCDLSDARMEGATIAGANFGGAKLKGVNLQSLKGVESALLKMRAAGRAMKKLAAVKSRHMRFEFRVCKAGQSVTDGMAVTIDSGAFGLNYQVAIDQCLTDGDSQNITDALREAFRRTGGSVAFHTIEITARSPSVKREPLKTLVIDAISEAFGQSPPRNQHFEEQNKAWADQQKSKRDAYRNRHAIARKAEARRKQLAKKQLERRIARKVGKVTDIATFLKALELRADKSKIDKATKMLKAERFKLFNDITDTHLAGVIKSQTDPDLVYACRIESDGQYACCTQNLNICGGLRGSICKHLLVLIIGLVKAGELDPGAIDAWVAKTHDTKPELNKETMGEIFIKYKGAEAGEVDWRPTETLPEDYYAL